LPAPETIAPFNREKVPQFTQMPNPGFTWGQRVDATEMGREWLEGGKDGWTVIDPEKEDPQ